MGKLARRAVGTIKRTVGRVGRLPRILNVDTGQEIYGHIEANANATTPFSRGKVHRGTFCCAKNEMANGALVYDRSDQEYYFVMDGKAKLYNGEHVWIDATMYRCDKIVEIQRFGTGVTKDIYGRDIVSTPAVIYTGLRAMFNPMNYDVVEQQDRQIAHNKIKLCVQSKNDVKVADRAITTEGSVYYVTSIDRESLNGLILCTVDADTR